MASDSFKPPPDHASPTFAHNSLIQHKLASGIPQDMHSCHTGQVEGYMIEGHIPPADIRRLMPWALPCPACCNRGRLALEFPVRCGEGIDALGNSRARSSSTGSSSTSSG